MFNDWFNVFFCIFFFLLIKWKIPYNRIESLYCSQTGKLFHIHVVISQMHIKNPTKNNTASLWPIRQSVLIYFFFLMKPDILLQLWCHPRGKSSVPLMESINWAVFICISPVHNNSHLMTLYKSCRSKPWSMIDSFTETQHFPPWASTWRQWWGKKKLLFNRQKPRSRARLHGAGRLPRPVNEISDSW